MIINPNDIKLECFKDKTSKNGQIAYPFRSNFVKLTHLPSGISVTKESRAQVIAKNDAMEELEVLVELWEGE